MAAQCDDACQTTTEGNQHVVDGRRGACQKLALGIVNRRDKEIDRSRGDTEYSGDNEIAPAASQQFKVVYSSSQAHACDRTHERRDKHRTYDDCSRVGVQAKRSHQNGNHKNPELGSAEVNTSLDILDHLLLTCRILAKKKQIFYEI